jgi:hypothetical protein
MQLWSNVYRRHLDEEAARLARLVPAISPEVAALAKDAITHQRERTEAALGEAALHVFERNAAELREHHISMSKLRIDTAYAQEINGSRDGCGPGVRQSPP